MYQMHPLPPAVLELVLVLVLVLVLAAPKTLICKDGRHMSYGPWPESWHGSILKRSRPPMPPMLLPLLLLLLWVHV